MSRKKKPISLLIVDDEIDFLTATSSALERRGMEVMVASSGEKALEKVKQKKFDVAVLDVKMPAMDGVELFYRIRKIQRGLPVILLTGHASMTQAFETLKEGVFDYIAKPCDIEKLVEKIKMAVSNQEMDEMVPSKSKHLDQDVLIQVLLVDDEELLLDSLKKTLDRRGMVVLTAENGKKALTILKEVIVDVVVLDVKMPGMDGLEVLSRIRKIKPDIKVILLTGHPTVETALEGVKLGAMEYITKPPNIEELVKSIKRANTLRIQTLQQKQQETIEEIMKRYPD